jgi:catechol 2,3-dioxygenase-like lactoylglutathione lyase family enzyme
MSVQAKTEVNVQQAVPFFAVTSMDQSLRFYMDGLGFTMKYRWIDEGKLRWCWLEIGGAALMLQEYKTEGPDSWKPEGKVGVGVSVYFQCRDALSIYRDSRERGLEPRRPFVGNAMWVVTFTDPDGYKILFESPTDAPEESEYTE